MDADIESRAATGQGAVKNPPTRGVARVEHEIAARKLHTPEAAGLNHLANFPNQGREAHHVSDHEPDAMPSTRINHLLALFDVHGHGLLAEDVLACLGREDRVLGMQRIR